MTDFFDFTDLYNAVSGTEFEEIPVDIETFVTSEEYLDMGQTPLSEFQYQAVRASTQIYKRETLHALYGYEKGEERWAQTRKECIFKIGKGGGKDFVSTIACAYVVYLLLCLKDPARYYGKPPGDTIDILNIAINAQQAQNVFFKGFKNRITRAPWFVSRYDLKGSQIDFDKNISVYSGHSERESWEGYNVLFVVLDEISGFDHDTSGGPAKSKTAQAIYDMYRASVTSRFPDFGKLVLLSFPRYKGDFISERYDKVIAHKEVVKRQHSFVLKPDDPNSPTLDIEWDEDHIVEYEFPDVFALSRPSWDFNPTKVVDDYMMDFLNDAVQALSRYACMPPDAEDAFFKDREKVEACFKSRDPMRVDGTFADWFQADPTKKYYIHVDLARVQDRAAVSMAHVEKFQQSYIGGRYSNAEPVVVVDLVKYWTPTANQSIDFTDIREFVVALHKRGFDIGRVTFDRWESADMMEYMNSIGLRSERLSVAKKHYTDLAIVVHEGRLSAPAIKLAVDELLSLRLMPNDTVDHPRKGGKDVSDSICGAVFNAISLTPKYDGGAVTIKTLADYEREEDESEANPPSEPDRKQQEKVEDKEMPDDLLSYLMGMKVL